MKIENVVYIITNPQYPGYVKIGYASDLKSRLASLNTGALVEFEPYAVYETTKDNGDIEIHRIIRLLNPILRASKFDDGKAKQKEFFKLDPEEAFQLLENIAIVSGTRDKLYKVDRYFNKYEVFTYLPEKDKPKINGCPNSGSKHQIPDGEYFWGRRIKSLDIIPHAILVVKDGKMFLKSGSFVAPEAERTTKMKNAFNNLKLKDGFLIEDVPVKSVSTAGTIVRGKETDGWISWKDKDGNYIDIYRKKDT